jgi:hypothetical protein
MPSSAKATFEKWNRKLHFYLGLYFLFFLWLFLLTGLMLNHGRWFAAANQRVETKYERAIEVPTATGDLDRARDVMRQLGLAGEIEWPAAPQPAGHLDFNIGRPKDASQVQVDLVQKRAFIDHFDNQPLAVFRIFHTFSGSRYNAPGNGRDWVLTTVWVIAMDALAAGLIVMVLGSYYMWYRLKSNHTLGFIVLAAGFASCATFLASLLI